MLILALGPFDINEVGNGVSITADADDVKGKFVSKMTQDAFTLAIGGSVVNAIQSAQSWAPQPA